jgi:LDH2 family malate/lactate/ureidoglycolate dehydrogenase
VLAEAQRLQTFTAKALECVGVASEDARIAADVVVTADLRGIASHGIARLHHYLAQLKQGHVNPELRLNDKPPSAWFKPEHLSRSRPH